MATGMCSRGSISTASTASRHVVRAEQIDWKPWWPRWISMDWGFEHPAAVYWHAQGQWETAGHADAGGERANAQGKGVVTYREYVTHRTPPRELAREIVARCVAGSGNNGSGDAARVLGSGADRYAGREIPRYARDDNENQRRGGYEREKIDAIYLSPDAFARRTDEASIAEQMGDIFAAAELPRPVPADDDRVGGWMLMYQMRGSKSSMFIGLFVIAGCHCSEICSYVFPVWAH